MDRTGLGLGDSLGRYCWLREWCGDILRRYYWLLEWCGESLGRHCWQLGRCGDSLGRHNWLLGRCADVCFRATCRDTYVTCAAQQPTAGSVTATCVLFTPASLPPPFGTALRRCCRSFPLSHSLFLPQPFSVSLSVLRHFGCISIL